jgi:predicted nuclease of predicted toxin-antitoxin system
VRFLADESCDFAAVRALQAAGHDVSAVAEVLPGAPDDRVMSLAISEDRILLTEDRDFGRLAFAQDQTLGGVIYIRFPAHARATLAPALVGLVDQVGDKLRRRFVVLQPGRVRITD